MQKLRRILVVDDEPDVLETAADILESWEIETASSYESAGSCLQERYYDAVVLDIMGVRGFDLLRVAVERNFPAIMLTAPGLKPEYILKSIQGGAISCLPKEDLCNLDSILDDLLEILDRGQDPWVRTMERLGPFLRESFTPERKLTCKGLWFAAEGDPESDE